MNWIIHSQNTYVKLPNKFFAIKNTCYTLILLVFYRMRKYDFLMHYATFSKTTISLKYEYFNPESMVGILIKIIETLQLMLRCNNSRASEYCRNDF